MLVLSHGEGKGYLCMCIRVEFLCVQVFRLHAKVVRVWMMQIAGI